MKMEIYKAESDLVLRICSMALVLLLCISLWLLRLPDVEWTIALNGFSPIDWVAHLELPGNFAKDFANGMATYDKSSFMHLYPLASSWIGVSPEYLIKWVILFEIVFLVFCAVTFNRALVPTAPPIAAYVFALLLVSGYTNMDLANFGRPTFWGLYYNAADGLRLIGIAYFLRGRILISSILLAVSLTIHPVMGLTACVFVAGCMVARPNAVSPRRTGLAMIVFLCIAGGWWFWKTAGATLSSGLVDPKTWVEIARAFNYHLFPFDYGLLTIYHDYRLLPLVCLVALAAGYLPMLEKDSHRRKSLVVGMAFLVVTTLVGLLISVYLPQPALVKLALQRASDMLMIIALAFAVAGLVAKIVASQHFLERALAMVVLISPFLMKPGFAALPVMLLLAYRSKDTVQAETAYWHRRTPYVFGMLVLGMAALYAAMNVLQIGHWPAYLGSMRVWTLTLVAAGVLYLFRFLSPSRQRQIDTSTPLLVVVVVGLLFGYGQWQAVPGDQERRLGKGYLETQRWAKEHTAPAALFLVDPTIYYGWRDFSERSSFGNAREWLHTSWLYDSKVEQYREGMRRFGEFGLHLEDYLNEKPSIDGFNKLDRDLKKRFYELEPDRLAEIGLHYGVDYFVMKRSLIRTPYPFEKVFQNDSFVIFRSPENSQGVSAGKASSEQ